MTTSTRAETGARNFGARVRALRLKHGLTQRDLAQRVNCSEVTVRKIEAGGRNASPQLAGLLATHLRVPAHEHAAFVALAAAGAETISPPLDALIGRDDEISRAVNTLTATKTRLLVLVGTGGVGKTSIANHVLRLAGPHFAEGVLGVPLAAISDPDLLAATLCNALAIEPATQRALHNQLRARHMLLLLDNFEQITSAATQVVALLEACPKLKVLVTSRHRLNVPGEMVQEVRPLPPAEAQRLFMQRAGEANPAMIDAATALASAEQDAIRRVCDMLDGLPLAIELVAARCKLMRPAQLLQRLAVQTEPGRFKLDLVADGISNLPARQRTLRETVQWSHALLNAAEQRALRWLAVFEGGWSLEAAEALLSDDAQAGSETHTVRVWNQLSVLIDRSFVHRVPADGEDRFAMLETIREFLLDALRASGEEDAARLAHARYLRKLALAANTEWHPAPDPALAGSIQAETHNLRAAMHWALAHNQVALAFDVCRALTQHWQFQGNGAEAMAWINRCLNAAGPDTPAGLVMMARCDLARLHWRLSDMELATRKAEAALIEAEAAQHKLAIIHALRTLGNCAHDGGRFAQALAINQRALAICDQPGDRFQRCRLLINSGMTQIHAGDLPAAQHFFDQALQLVDSINDPIIVTVAYLGMGMVCVRAGHADGAAQALHTALAHIERNQFLSYLPETFTECAQALALQGRWQQAAQLLGAASGVSGHLREQMNPMDHNDYAAAVRAVRAALPAGAFDAAFAAGAALSHPHAIALGKQWLADGPH